MRASLTKLTTTVTQLESKADETGTQDLVQQAKLKLQKLDSEFKSRHYDLLDELEEQGELDAEQVILDAHDDQVAALSVRLEKLSASCGPKSSGSRVIYRRFRHLKRALSSIEEAIDRPALDPTDICLLRQYEESLGDLKRELGDARSSLYSLDIVDDDEICGLLASVEDSMFGCSLKLKKLVEKGKKLLSSESHSNGVKLPKLEVPVFDGDILQWKTFWEQFSVSVHDRPNLSNSEKLVYLQQALKGGSAKQAIEGLSKSGDNYKEAIKCLQARYDRPRLIHQTHVKKILDTPPLKDGSGR